MKIDIFDTTLRDGFQQEGISPSVKDKIAIAKLIDSLGVSFIEGGWPGASPKEEEFFETAKRELKLKNAKLVSFGSTRKLELLAKDDPQVKALVDSGTDYICIVGKSSKLHITKALQTDVDSAIDMAVDTILYLKSKGKKVFFDAEHFFDGYKEDSETSLKILESVVTAGADCFIFCDTNGGTLPEEVRKILSDVIVSLKQNYETISSDSLEKLTQTANHIAELVNVSIDSRHPYVGSSAFTHKAGLHASGMSKDSSLYEHIDASKVGNFTRTTVSELAGRASVITKAEEFGLSINNDEAKDLIQQVQNLEHIGFQFEAADASLFILMNSIKGIKPDFFEFESFRVFSERRNSENVVSEAVCKITVNNNRYVKTGEGVGPVDALSKALKSALENDYKDINNVKLIDYKVRIIDSSDGTEAKTRVLIEFTDSKKQWSTIGVHENIINASWNALCDGFNYYFMTS